MKTKYADVIHTIFLYKSLLEKTETKLSYVILLDRNKCSNKRGRCIDVTIYGSLIEIG